MGKRKVLIAASNYWTSPFKVGSHHYAREFARMGWQVAFISDPISPLHFLFARSAELFQRYDIWKSGPASDLGGNLLSYVPLTILAPHNKAILRSSCVAKYWPIWTLPNVHNIIRKMDFEEVDLLWFDSITQSFWLDVIKYKKSVLRIADKNIGFTKNTVAIQAMEHELIGKADLVVYTAKNLAGYIKSYKPKLMSYVPNGVNIENFTDGKHAVPSEYTNIPEPRVIYVGAIEDWFDLNLVKYCAESLPDVSFVLIGPPKIDTSSLTGLKNVFLLGSRRYEQLPGYLSNSQVGIIPFIKNHPVVNSIHPIKLYEYLACGLTVVSVGWEELNEIKLNFFRADNYNQFVNFIKTGIENKDTEKQNLKLYSWEKATEKILKLINFNDPTKENA